MRAKMPFLALAVLAAGAVGTAGAVPFAVGDVFAAIGGGQVQHWRPGTGLLATYNTTRGGFTTGMGFDAAGNLYVTNFSDASVSRFDTTGALLNAQFVTSSAGNVSPESIVFDSAGNFYVGHADGLADIEKYSAAGAFLGAFNVATEARGSDWIDLAADQKTMYYTSEDFRVKRFDVAANVQLPDFAVLSDRPAFALRLLPTGGALVADSASIKRLDAAGLTVQTYDVAGHNSWFALNLDPDGTSFWSGDFGTGQFHQFDIASGALLDSYNTLSGGHFGLAVYGEITVSTLIPEPGTMTLLGLGFAGLGGLVWRRRRKA